MAGKLSSSFLMLPLPALQATALSHGIQQMLISPKKKGLRGRARTSAEPWDGGGDGGRAD